MELLRRLLLVICTLAAVSALLSPAPVLYHVEQPDFAGELARHPYRWEHKGQTPEQYMREETRGLVLALPAGKWQAIAERLRSGSEVYLRADAPVIRDVIDQWDANHSTLYLRAEGTPAGQLLRISRLTPGSSWFSRAPFLYRHPHALWSPLLFLAGLLFYIFLPRRRFDGDTLCYGAGFAAVVGPDLVAWLFVTGFFTLGLGVGLSAAPGGLSTLLSCGLIIPMLVLWAFPLFGLYLFRIAARYAGTGLRCNGGRLIYYAPSGTQTVSAGEVDSVRLGHWRASRWLTRLGLLVSLLNWRAAGPTLLNASRHDPLLEVHLKNGLVWPFVLTGACNLEPLVACLVHEGISVDRALREAGNG